MPETDTAAAPPLCELCGTFAAVRDGLCRVCAGDLDALVRAGRYTRDQLRRALALHKVRQSAGGQGGTCRA